MTKVTRSNGPKMTQILHFFPFIKCNMHVGSTIRINKIYTIDKKNVKVKSQDQGQKSELGWPNIDI